MELTSLIQSIENICKIILPNRRVFISSMVASICRWTIYWNCRKSILYGPGGLKAQLWAWNWCLECRSYTLHTSLWCATILGRYFSSLIRPNVCRRNYRWPYKFLWYCAETEQGVAHAIIRSVVDFKREPWPRVSEPAKDLVKRMLDPNPLTRLTAAQVLGEHYHITFFYCITLYRTLSPSLRWWIESYEGMPVLCISHEQLMNNELTWLYQLHLWDNFPITTVTLLTLWAEHPWLHDSKKNPDIQLGDAVRAKLQQFSAMNKLKKKALRVRLATCWSQLHQHPHWPKNRWIGYIHGFL
jgi:serine/threonine protein kinase